MVDLTADYSGRKMVAWKVESTAESTVHHWVEMRVACSVVLMVSSKVEWRDARTADQTAESRVETRVVEKGY